MLHRHKLMLNDAIDKDLSVINVNYLITSFLHTYIHIHIHTLYMRACTPFLIIYHETL